ncbi:hypothetical protein [Olene mendosa nucleopolyhedrovirus]|uniref:Uncharacterized protein n=1 Tax=Olene mendosa nucleopolyhedrovirus TaxID=2933796 RepID=A0AAX3AUX1_9ABAC|nr:hypothetical protein QKV28_gp030 [Olene mendosa nucleopolyhedrovirus]UOQ18813.1 hypothetical protein [Olene mendosa nucleopolyhedrovirus]
MTNAYFFISPLIQLRGQSKISGQKCLSPNFKNSILSSANARSISCNSRVFFVMRLILSQCSILMASRFLV